MVTTASGFAFPSGHATQAAAVYGGFAWLAAGWVTAWARKVAVWTGAVLAVLVVGVSRVYLGVHWPTDVLGGWALGGLWLAGVLVTVSTGRQVWFSDDARQAEADSRQ